MLRITVIAAGHSGATGCAVGVPAQVESAGVCVDALRWADERAVAGVLARAFIDDPLVVAICRGAPARRLRRLWWSFRIAVRSHCLAGQPAWTIVDAAGVPLAVALVIRPPVPSAPVADGWFALWGSLRVGPGTTRRSLLAAHAIRRHEPLGQFTYLRTLAVDPAWQRRGLGSRLVRQVQRASAPQLPLYLETSRAENVGFYRRLGFELAGEFTCLGVRLWRLLRAPAGAT
ncbi:GNAT family N-acetyltransferase [Candidatus Binatia bacterium]|nr:GNAT family N-acetyltransferase [Candidatus Binatia bacterium]